MLPMSRDVIAGTRFACSACSLRRRSLPPNRPPSRGRFYQAVRVERTALGVARRSGFSLIELLVVLAVMGFALVLIVGYKAPWSATLNLRGAAAELAAGLRLARSEAIAHNRPVVLAVDPAGHRYRVGGAPPRRLPSQLSVALLTVSGEQRTATTGDIRFNPDGSSTGGRIVLADGARRVAVGVDWLTGRVTVADAH
jgi:general secretion pathway protein H